MAEIVPFIGLRYAPERVGEVGAVLSPPYDVIGESERAALEALHPENVVRVELPRGDGDARYAAAANLLGAWTAEGILRPDTREAFYVYEQQFTFKGLSFTRRGFFAAVHLEPYERRVVLPHEETLTGPKEDRLRLMRATRTQISPIFGLFRDGDGAARSLIAAASERRATVDVKTPNDVRHRLWVIEDGGLQAELAGVLRSKQILIADGHHRYETLLALAPELRPLDSAAGQAASDFGLMYLAPAEDPGLLVLATHRLVRGIADFDLAALRASASPAFDISEGDEDTPAAIEERLAREGAERVTFAVRVPGSGGTTWFSLKPILDLSALGPPALRKLDVTVLHGIILAPLLAIDEEAMANQSYLGYTHDTAEAMARVASGEYQAAFLMNPTKMDQVLAACEAGFTLPQKSTYFQPKLATGLVMYRLDGPAPQPPR
jgi:uncharacterized protein (DUF1015 family)